MSGSDSAERDDLISVEECKGPFYDALRATIPPVMRVSSVLPVAFRYVARRTPNPLGAGTVMDAMLAQASADPDMADALEYAVIFKRADLIAAGLPAELADRLLTKAAALPDSGAILETVPVVPPPADEETSAP